MDDKPKIKVVDRRRFTSDGAVREGAEALQSQQSREERKPVTPPPAQAETPRGPSREPARQGPAEQHGIDFMSFIASLATNALAALGALPEVQGMPQNPELAREYIDVIAMLQHKTKGNLSAAEERALTQVLADLRLQFVQRTQSRGKRPQ